MYKGKQIDTHTHITYAQKPIFFFEAGRGGEKKRSLFQCNKQVTKKKRKSKKKVIVLKQRSSPFSLFSKHVIFAFCLHAHCCELNFIFPFTFKKKANKGNVRKLDRKKSKGKEGIYCEITPV